MRLIVTEKNNSAKKIAEILGGQVRSDKAYKVPFYTWSDGDGEQMAIGLKGHVLNPAFPEGYSNWQQTDLHELIDAELVKEATDKNVLRAVRKVAKDATSVVIATDFDREGELIGLEALTEILDVNPELEGKVKRARYSALTKEEIERAFSELDELSYDLAYAGAARQDIDLIWGATLTRAVSLATRRFGSNFLSVGRVQSPTLGLIVERELERRAHVPKPYWELLARFAPAEGDVFEAHHTEDKFWDKAEAKAALAATTDPGRVVGVSSRRNTRRPPTPYNTTAFTTDASNRLGITPSRAMRIAEDLYMDGFISYPRTDNTVYPSSLPLRELVSSLVRIREFEAAAPLLEGSLTPTRGKKETTDHPPIHPTQAIHPGAFDDAKRRVYELVVRRFLATFSPPMITESTRADIEAGTQTYFVRGSVVVDPGFASIYTYARSADEEIPPLVEGQELKLEEAWMLDKETQPPSRIGQGKLIEMMEERGLGTKATRPDIIQKLFDRGYVYSNPPIPSETGIAMYEAFKRYVPPMATPEMTAELESDMDQIAAGEISKDEVLRISREMLHSAYDSMDGKREELAKVIWAGMDEDKFLGPCKVCEEAGRKREDGSPNRLRIINTKGGKRFAGCEGYNRDDPDDPDSCTFSHPLPGRGYDLWRLEERCSICDQTPRLTVKGFRGRPWKLCLNDDCPSMVEMRQKREERERAKKAKEEAKAAANGDGAAPRAAEDAGGEEASGNGAAAKPAKAGNGAASKAKSGSGAKPAAKRTRKPRSPGRQGARGRAARSRASKS
jgi:DNA topoisomerase-1